MASSSEAIADPVAFEQTLATLEENLALDEVLLTEADAGRGPTVVRFWEPWTVGVVLGASRRISDDVLADVCRRDGIVIGRRSSGGGTVLVGPGTLNVTVVVHVSTSPELESVASAQAFVLERIAAAIRLIGRDVRVAGSGDLVLDGRKCGGSAQRRLKGCVMVHCSILNDFAIEFIERYLPVPMKQPAYRGGRAHRDFLCDLSVPRDRLVASICGSWTGSETLSAAPAWPRAVLESLLIEKFANRDWIERF
jgi:lipoate-protein ligase A